MLPLIWARGLLIAGLISLVTALGYTGYSKVKQIGYDEAASKYELLIKNNQDEINAKIRSIEVNSNLLIEQQKANSTALASDISSITKGLKGKTLTTIVKNGECTPSTTFSDSFTTINKRVNESLK